MKKIDQPALSRDEWPVLFDHPGWENVADLAELRELAGEMELTIEVEGKRVPLEGARIIRK